MKHCDNLDVELIDGTVEKWQNLEKVIANAVLKMGGSLSAEIHLSAEPRERVYVGHKPITRVYSRALITLQAARGDKLHFSFRAGVVGKSGTFYPSVEDADLRRLFDFELKKFQGFVVYIGGAQKFADAFFSAAKKAAEVDDLEALLAEV